jgi:TonB-linked SusC/RagA family outer membrane protein
MRTIVIAAKLFKPGKAVWSLFLLLTTTVLWAQEKTVTGVVRSAEDKQPVAGATVQVKGTNVRVATDENGAFTIKVADNQTLVVSGVGFTAMERTAGSGSTVNFDLERVNAELESVVVTALGIRREEKALGYSVSKVKGEDITDAMSNNWTNALTGKVAGINLIKSGGGPSGTNKIVLRGENSLNGNSEALIVVDGVIISGSSGQMTGTGSGAYLQGDSPVDFGTSLNDINPEDIESVTVLKGPGASALYGARGANGAIIVTTKSGRPNQKGLGVSFSSNAMVESINRWPDYQYEYGQGATQQHTWYSYNGTEDGPSTRSTSSAWGPAFNGQLYYQYDPVTRDRGAVRTPWVPYKNNRRDFFEIGRTLTNSITVEGGGNGTSARLSLTNLNNTWIVPNTGYGRNTVALSVNQRISDKLQIASKVNYTNKKSDNLPSTGYNNQSIMYFIRGMTPNMNIDWFKDYWVPGQEHIAQTRPFSSLLDNPYLISYEMLNKSNRHGVIGNISATYNFTKDLSVMIRSSLDYASEARSQQRPMGTQKFVEGMFRTQNIFTQEINSDFLFRYNKNFGNRFTTTVSAGGSKMANRYVRDENRADQLIYPGIYTLANSKNLLASYPNRSEYRVNSLYGMAQVGFDNFLYLDLTARQDWASTLASPESADNTGFFYPSVNLSAVLSEKVNLPDFVSFLKLRGSWAKVGSGGIVPYRTSYFYTPTIFPGGQSNPSAIANPNLTALLTTSVETGLDVRFLKNRIGLDVALYQNNTRGDIFQVPIDPASGYSSSIENAGLVRNKGIEVQVDGTVFKSAKGFTWNIFGTYYSNRNQVVELVEGTDTYVMSTGPSNRGSIEARPGGRMGDLYGIGYEKSPDGQIVYNNQGLPTLTQTQIYLGNTNPDWKGSIGTELKYKNFRMNVLFDGQFGAVAYSLTHSVLAEEGKLKKTVPGRYNGIIGNGVQLDPATNKYIPNTTVATNIQAYYLAHFVRDNVESNTFSTDFIKLRELRLEYTVPAGFLKSIRLQRATLGVYGRDLWVRSNWPSFDPEFGTLNDGQINAGFEIGQFPSTRSMGIALNIGL